MNDEANSKPVVLLAEDDPLLRMCAALMLQEHGFDVVEAETGDNALQLLRTGATVDALVTDIEMPGSLNGLDLAKIAKEEFPKLGVVVVSGHIKLLDGELPLGARFFGKPIDDALVIAALRESLA